MRVYGSLGLIYVFVMNQVACIEALSAAIKVRNSRVGRTFFQLSSPSTKQRRHYVRSRITMMPEGPEVRTVVDQLQPGVGMNFHGVTFLSGRYVRHGPPDGYDDFAKTLDKEVDIVKEWNAKGKFIYIVLNDGNNKSRGDDFRRSIWITLGMSGRFVAESMNEQQLTEPRWVFKLEGQEGKPVNIFYHDPRNFGTLKFSLSSRALDYKLLTLGPDILHADTTTEDVFVQLVAAQKPELNICKFLMNQKVGSQIGI
jgi:formamidopyrimidine-DNA glycosylase